MRASDPVEDEKEKEARPPGERAGMKEPRLRLGNPGYPVDGKLEWKMRGNAPFRGLSKPSHRLASSRGARRGASSLRLARARRGCPRIRRRCQDLRLRVGAAASEGERDRKRERERGERVAVRDQVSYSWHYQVKYGERCPPPEKSTRMRESRNPGNTVARPPPVRAAAAAAGFNSQERRHR